MAQLQRNYPTRHIVCGMQSGKPFGHEPVCQAMETVAPNRM